MKIDEGKIKKGGVNKAPKTKRPAGQPLGQGRGRDRRHIEPKPFRCKCGATFFKRTTKNKAHCIKCKGIAEESDTFIHPKPIWKEVTERKPFCPRCDGSMTGIRDYDVRTMFDYRCVQCGYVC